MALVIGPSRQLRIEFIDRLDDLTSATLRKAADARAASSRGLEAARTGIIATCALSALAVLIASLWLVRAMFRTSRQLQRAGVNTATSTTQLTASIREQEAAVTEQSASTAEIAASVKEISATAQDLSHNMDQIAQITETTSRQAAVSREGLLSLDQTMRQMLEASAAIVNKLAVLNDKAANINTIVTTINKLADQTNLLSLNAAIQAEKAGEEGLGFGVVASEIRRLADQTAIATNDIEQVLKDMQSAVSASVMGMDRFSVEIRRNVDEVHTVGEQLAQVAGQIQEIGPRFETIQEGMRTQSLGSDQIAQTMLQFSEGMRQTMEAVRSSQQSITLLGDAVRDVQDVVARL